MIKLYGGELSRAAIVRWYLEELGLEYELIRLDMKNQEHLQPAFLALNPMGKVPVIEDGAYVLAESGAILLYLAQKYGQFPGDIQAQGKVYEWVLFANSTLPMAALSPEAREQQLPRLLMALDHQLQGRSFLVGTDFTVADVAVGSVLSYLERLFNIDLSAYGAIATYLQGLSDRPAFRKGLIGEK